jgi:hypothetical protein
MGYEDLCDLIAATELYNGFGDVPATHRSRFNLKTPSEPKVPFYRLPLFDW